MDAFIDFVQTVGFPIVLSFYLLHRIEQKLDAILQALLQSNRVLTHEEHKKVA